MLAEAARTRFYRAQNRSMTDLMEPKSTEIVFVRDVHRDIVHRVAPCHTAATDKPSGEASKRPKGTVRVGRSADWARTGSK